MQLRDYPHPLLDITEITITGRMMFAEQEAQERGAWDWIIYYDTLYYYNTRYVLLS
jgi:hypothetical protein